MPQRENKALEALAEALARKVKRATSDKPRLKIVKPAPQPARAYDDVTRTAIFSRIRFLCRSYQLRWLLEQETFDVPCMEVLDDGELAAVLQTLGYTGGLIARLIVAEGLIVGLLGGVVGTLAAVAVIRWGDFTLSQLTADGFAIRKRTKPGHGWISAAAGRRAPVLAGRRRRDSAGARAKRWTQRCGSSRPCDSARPRCGEPSAASPACAWPDPWQTCSAGTDSAPA